MWDTGRYVMIRRIATGGMGEVYLATDSKDPRQRPVAVKVMLPEYAEDPEAVNRFLDEARIVSGLSHENICQVYDHGMEAGRHFIAMEYLHGHSLHALLRRAKRDARTIPPAVAAYVVARAAQGLAYAHERQSPTGASLELIHRDVSPGNILLTFDGRVKVVDFGIAHARDRATLTTTGVIRGKIDYMAPEQMLGQSFDVRVDVFALGAVLFELLTGARLYGTGTDTDILRGVADGSLPPRIDRAPEMEGRLLQIIAEATRRDRSVRTPSARTLSRQLDEAARELDPTVGHDHVAMLLMSHFAPDAVLPATGTSEEQWSRLAAGSNSPGTRRVEPAAASPSAPAQAAIGQAAIGQSVTAQAATGQMPAEDAASVPIAFVSRSVRRRAVMPLALGGLGVLAAGGLVVAASWAARRASEHVPPVSKALVSSPALASPPPSGIPGPPISPAEGLLASKEPPDAPVPETAAAPVPKRTTSRRKLVAKQSEPRRTTADSPGRTGRLTLDTSPWTDVFFQGRKLGTTPIVEVLLPVGRHKLRAVNRDMKIDRSIEIEIEENRTTAQRIGW